MLGRARARRLDAPTHIAICKAQQKGEFYDMQTAIVPLLKEALSAQKGKFQAILSGESDALVYQHHTHCLDSHHTSRTVYGADNQLTSPMPIRKARPGLPGCIGHHWLRQRQEPHRCFIKMKIGSPWWQ